MACMMLFVAAVARRFCCLISMAPRRRAGGIRRILRCSPASSTARRQSRRFSRFSDRPRPLSCL